MGAGYAYGAFILAVASILKAAQFSSMSLTLVQIVEETRRWPDDVVAELIDRIVIAKHGRLDADHAAQWGKVAEGRAAESERDPSVLVSGRDVAARVHKIIKE